MSYSLKAVLKSLDLLFLSKKENILEKERNIVKIFFNKITFCDNCKKAFELYSHFHHDVIITDMDFEDNCAIKLCKEIKEINHNIPIIILSKKKDEKLLFEAIRLQVIDYIVRPAKVENLISALNETAKHILNHGEVIIKINKDLFYNYKEKSVKKDKEEIKLTKNEFRLLELLLVNKEHNLTKEEIERHLWADEYITESAFKSLFSRLRQKIGKDVIKNSFGIGYQLAK